MINEQILVNKDSILQLHHKLRNPLNSILGLIQIIAEDDNLEISDKKVYLEVIAFKTNEFLENVDDIFDSLSKKTIPE